jgi:hypothetical protein
MKNLMRKFWSDDAGFVLSSELLFYFVIVVLAAAYGFQYLRLALVSEFAEAANNLIQLDNSLSFAGITDAANPCVGTLNGYNVSDFQGVFDPNSQIGAPTIISANPAGQACP